MVLTVPYSAGPAAKHIKADEGEKGEKMIRAILGM